MKGTHGVFIVMVTTRGPVTSIDWIGVSAGPVSREAWWALKLAATAAPSHGAPLWNVTFGRTVIVHTVPEAFEVTDSARLGWGSPLASRIMRVSNTVRAYMIPTSSKVPWVGENPFSSASTPKTSDPPRFGVAVETPSGRDPVEPPPVVEELEFELEHAESRPPDAPATASPAPATALLARNERRSMRSVMVPLWTVAPGARRSPLRCGVSLSRGCGRCPGSPRGSRYP